VIFVDTSFWVAWLNSRDQHHGQAVTLAAWHQSSAWVTTNQVRGETWTFLRRRADHSDAVRFLDAVEASVNTHVVRVGAEREEMALRWLRRHDEREYSFVDATSFLTMEAEGITQALAFDGDFSAAGFTELRSG
jgi:predicted nucleic acid-binding protein